MKKIYCFLLICIVQESFSQNTFPTSGSVGIGTASPASPLHVTGAARIDGGLGIGTSSLSGSVGYIIRSTKNITGGATSVGFAIEGAIKPDVTRVWSYYSAPSLDSTANLTNGLLHFVATQGTMSGTMAAQTGFYVDNLAAGATNMGIRSRLSEGANKWNLYIDGTANNYMSGSLGIGSTTLNGYGLRLSRTITGGAGGSASGVVSEGQIQSDITNAAVLNKVILNTQATSFALNEAVGYAAYTGTIGTGSTITAAYAYYAANNWGTPTNIANSYGFFSNITSGTGRWNFYAKGNANNYFEGNLGIGSTGLTGYNLRLSRNIEGSADAVSVYNDGVIQSSVNSTATYYRTNAKIVNEANLTSLYHFSATQGGFGSGTVTNQYGFHANSAISGATNNYGFYGNVPAGTGSWNFYANGAAKNYFNSSVLIGKTTGTAKVDVEGTIRATSSSVPTEGTGLEISYGAGQGEIYPYNRVAGAFMPLRLRGKSMKLYAGSVGGIDIDSAGNIGIGVTPTNILDVKTGSQGTYGKYALIRSSQAVAYQGGLLLSNVAGLTDGYSSFKISPSYNLGPYATVRMGFVANTNTETFLNSGAAIELFYNGNLSIAKGGTGNIAVGHNATPVSRFDINGTISLRGNDGAVANSIAGGVNVNGAERSMQFSYNSTSSTEGFLFKNTNNSTNLLFIRGDGKVGIGTTNIPTDYKLAVGGNIIAEKIKVKKQVGGVWPDYVFSSDYNLPSLEEVERFTKENKHLPEIPSAKEIEKDGQDLGEMNGLLLKKVEELTLYLIDLKKQNDKLNTLIESQSKKIAQQDIEIEKLKHTKK